MRLVSRCSSRGSVTFVTDTRRGVGVMMVITVVLVVILVVIFVVNKASKKQGK